MKKHLRLTSLVLFAALVLSACGPGQMFGPTLTSTSTITFTPTVTSTPTLTFTPTLTPTLTITPTPTPFVATFDNKLCEIKGSFVLDGELSFTGVFAHIALEHNIEGKPSYALNLYGNSTDGIFHNLTIWVRHSSSPGPNEMATLPKQFKDTDINIYTSNNTVLHANLEKIRLHLHVIPLQITEPGDDPLGNCDYVVEEIQPR